jgi:regulator of protease activity HflC (stomatin/prohibitin superfamily)
VSLNSTGTKRKKLNAQGERKMRNQKKILSKKNEAQEVEAENKYYELVEKAKNGDTNSMMKLLASSGRGYDLTEQELNEFLTF